jgi:hypothetical protein
MNLDFPTIAVVLPLVAMLIYAYWLTYRERALDRQRCLREIESAGGFEQWKAAGPAYNRSMAQVVINPFWAPWFFMAEGALFVLIFDGMLDRSWGQHADGLPFLAFMLGVIWWNRYRSRHQ